MAIKKQKKGSSWAQQTISDILEYGTLVIIAIFMMALVYFAANAVIGQLPAAIGTIIIGIVMVFIYVTSDKVKESINDWIKRKR